MRKNLEKSIEALLHHEGGFVNHPNDPGGMTNRGITLRRWEEYLGHKVDPENQEDIMRAISVEDAVKFYAAEEWTTVRADDLPSGLDFTVFDIAVNMGSGRAGKFLQSQVGATVDGAIGSMTIAAVEKFDNPVYLIKALAASREDFYKQLKHFDTFGKGWLRRTKETLDLSLQLAEQDV